MVLYRDWRMAGVVFVNLTRKLRQTLCDDTSAAENRAGLNRSLRVDRSPAILVLLKTPEQIGAVGDRWFAASEATPELCNESHPLLSSSGCQSFSANLRS